MPDTVDSTDKVTRDILKLAKQARNRVGHGSNFARELEYHSNVALRKAFKGMSSDAIVSQIEILKEGASTPEGKLNNLLRLARDQQKPSITNYVRGRLKRMQGQGLEGISVGKITGLLEKAGVEPTAIVPSEAYAQKADAWAKKLKIGKPSYMKVGGADVAQLFFGEGKSLYVPLSSRVPISQTNYDIFGMYKGAGSDITSFGDFLVDKIAKGDISVHKESAKSLSTSIEKYGEMFPRSAPASAGTGIETFWEKMRSKLVNIQIPGADKKKIIPTIEDAVASGKYYPSGKTGAFLKSGEGLIQMSYGLDMTKYMAFGNQFDLGRGISKWVRPELAFTESATEAMRARGVRGITTEAARKELGGRRSLDLVTLYGREKEFGLKGIGGEGEAFVRKELFQKGTFDIEQFKSHKVSVAGKLDIIAPEVERFMKTGKPVQLKPGTLIGMGFENLEEIRALSEGTEEIVGIKYAKDQQRLNIVTRRLIRGQSGVKVFDGLKHTLMETDLASTANKLWGKEGSDIVKRLGVDIAVGGDIVLKNPAARSTQMTSALSHLLRQSGMSEAAVDDIMKGHMGKMAKLTQDADVARNVLKMSKEASLGTTELGLIFGSYAGDTFEQTQSNLERVFGGKGLSSLDIKEIHKGRFLGISTVAAGGSELFGEVKTGGFEPRTAWMLESLGEEGRTISQMVTSRRLTQTAAGRRELEKAFATTTGAKGVFTPGQLAGAREVTPEYLLSGEMQSIFHQEGTMMKFTPEQMAKYGETLGGKEYMYLPSGRDVAAMSVYKQPSGEVGAGPLLRQYKRLFTQITEGEAASRVAGTMASLEEELVAQHITPYAGKGQKLFGTARAQVQTAEATGFRSELMRRISDDISSGMVKTGAQTFGQGISREAAEEIFSGMARQGASEEFIKAQRQALEAGKGVAGLMWRHPQIGKYSTVPAMFYMHEAATTGFTVQSGTIEMGLSMDVDADRLGGMFVMNKAEEDSVKRIINNDKFLKDFEDYKVKSSSIKAALKTSTNVEAFKQLPTVAKDIIAGDIGAVTSKMDQLMKGAIYTGDKRMIETMSLLSEYVPQELISAKHLSAAQAGSYIGIGERALHARTSEDVLGFIEERFNLDKFNKTVLRTGGGKDEAMTVQAAISRSFAGYETALKDEVFETSEALVGRAKGKTTGIAGEYAGNVAAYTESLERQRGTTLGRMFPEPTLALKKGSTGFSGTETLTTNMKTAMKAQFAGIGKGQTLVATAAAVAGALFYLGASKKEETPFGGYNIMEPPSTAPIQGTHDIQMPIPDLNFQAKPRYISADNIQGGQLKTGMPDAPRPIQQTPRAMVDQNTTPLSSKITIRANESANIDYNEITKKITDSMKIPSNINVNINDNSREITADMIDSLMENIY